MKNGLYMGCHGIPMFCKSKINQSKTEYAGRMSNFSKDVLILSIKSADNDILESCTKCLLWCTKLDNIVCIRFLVKMEKDVFLMQ